MNFLFNRTQKFVPFDTYFPQKESMSREQLLFYHFFKNEINRSNRPDINGNKSYPYLLAYEYLDLLYNKGKPVAKEVINKLVTLGNFYSYIDFNWWIGDIFCFIGNLSEALSFYKLNPKSTMTHAANRILNIKNHLQLPTNAPEILCINKKVTKFGQENFDKMVEFVNLLLKQESFQRGNDYLKYVSDKYSSEKKYSFDLFNGYPGGYAMDQKFQTSYKIKKTFCYYAIPEFLTFCSDVSRNAENLLREDLNLPKVGEGWITETELYYKIKSYFKSHEVIQHASPPWLGRQHLDIFLPELSIAIEYHGRQHFEPVAFFGGQETFEQNQKRDEMKRMKCKKNQVTLIEIQGKYEIQDVIKSIEIQMAKMNK